MTVYYNEIEPFAAQWLRNLILAGHLPQGDIDTRSITDVRPDDLRGYTQCHFFAGIGGWPYALRLAMWDDARPVWTGSCPCQPFSAAGKQKGQSDERHLWPVWFRLIREYRPSIIFGEQVASAVAFGWLDEVAHDMEAEGYAIGSSVLPACSVGAPHKRDRLWFVADAIGDQNHEEQQRPATDERRRRSDGISRCGVDSTQSHMGLSNSAGRNERRQRTSPLGYRDSAIATSSDLKWLRFPDGKIRPVKPSIRLLAHGVSRRVERLRGYGNAIVPKVATEFITAYMECRP